MVGITIKPPSAVSLSFSSIGEKSGAANLAPDYPNKSGAAKNPATDDDGDDQELPLALLTELNWNSSLADGRR